MSQAAQALRVSQKICGGLLATVPSCHEWSPMNRTAAKPVGALSRRVNARTGEDAARRMNPRRAAKAAADAAAAAPPIAARRDRRVQLTLLAVFAVAFAVFLRTCARTVTGEDAGELITAAATGGVAHPPGYPLWTMLAHAFTWLPFGAIAFRVALVSSRLGGAAWLCDRRHPDVVAAACATGSWLVVDATRKLAVKPRDSRGA